MGRGVDRFGLVALVAAGTLAAHEIGYLADEGASVSHAYLGVAGPLVLLAACVAAWLAAVRVLRDDPRRLPSVGALAAAQLGLYAIVEVAERVLGGAMSSLVSTPVVLGLVAQAVVAWLALRLLRLGRAVVVRLRRRRVRAVRSVLADAPTPATVFLSNTTFAGLPVRGPPV